MKEIKIKYELTNDKQVIVYCTEEQFSGVAPSIWPEITENAKNLAVQDMLSQIQFFKGTMIECEMEYPTWIDEPYKFVEDEE